MSCGVNTDIDAVKDLKAELNAAMAGGKAQLDLIKSKIASMETSLNSFKPEIPVVKNLQLELGKLSSLSNPLSLATKIAELKADFGSSLPDFDSLLGNLGLTSFPPSINLDSICTAIPNLELPPGESTPVEQPKESKIPKAVAPVEPVKEESKLPQESMARFYVDKAIKDTFGAIYKKTKRAYKKNEEYKLVFPLIRYLTQIDTAIGMGLTIEQYAEAYTVMDDIQYNTLKAKYPDAVSVYSDMLKHYNTNEVRIYNGITQYTFDEANKLRYNIRKESK